MDEEHFEQMEQTEQHKDSIDYTEHVNSEPIHFENTLQNSDEDDSLFEESIINSTFSPRAESEELDSYGFSEDEGDLLDHYPGDLVDLRGLFDEDAVDPLNSGTTLDFEEIPDDIDIDEPIEVEKLSRFGRIMNVVVLVTTILFCLIVVGFIINAAFVIGAVSSINIQTRAFVNISELDQAEANVDLTVLTEVTNFGRFIKGRLDPAEEVSASVYLIDNEGDVGNFNLKDVILSATYKPADNIEFDLGERRLIEMKGIKIRLNPHFDASRLSGFMETRNGDYFHKRYPFMVVIRVRALLNVNSFLVPFPFPVISSIDLPMHKIDKVLEELKKAKLNKFDFNPKFVDIEPPVGNGPLVLKVQQPVPKFYGPPTYEISVHIPEMELLVKQFEMTGNNGPHAVTDIKKLFKDDSYDLVTAKIKPFVFVMSDIDSTPNILNIEARIENSKHIGLMNILAAIRDGTINNMGFLFAPTIFHPDEGPLLVELDSDGKFEGIPFLDFMKTFWGRQAYPASDGTGPGLPSVPELYNPEIDPAFDIKLNSINVIEDPRNKLNLSFTVRANTHYVISQYNLPLLMLSGRLPKIDFAFHVKKSEELKHVAILSLEHQRNRKVDDKEMVFELQIQITDFDLFSKFAIKADRLYKIASSGRDPKANHIPALDHIQGGLLRAVSAGSWPSNFASVFDLEFNFKDDLFGFVYKKSGQAVLKDFPPKEPDEQEDNATPVYSRNEETNVIKELLAVFELNENVVNGGDVPLEVVILENVEKLKEIVAKNDTNYNQNSSEFGVYNIANAGKIVWEHKLDTKAENMKPINPSDTIEDVKNAQLSAHQKLARARQLLKSWEDLKRIQPVDKFPKVNGVYVHLDSKEAEMKINLAASLAMPTKKFDDHIKIQWTGFEVNFGSKSPNGQLIHADFSQGIVNYSLNEGQFYTTNSNYFRVNAEIGSKNVEVKSWMKTLNTFHAQLLDEKNSFVPFYLNFGPGSNVKFHGVIPGHGLSQLKPVAKIDEVNSGPNFFDNLSKSYFDFIGYGFYRLIFNAMLPNPDTCPFGSNIYNVEIELPPTAAFLFTKTEEMAPECVAAINTARPLRLWTQIVDGVLCNMYSVADGLDEQKLEIQGRIPSSKSYKIISSFSSVINLHKSYNTLYPTTETNEHPLKKGQRAREANLFVPNEKRFTLSTVVPVTIEFLNFSHFMKVMDDFSEKKHIQIFVNDPLTSVSTIESKNIPKSLMNNLIGLVASKYPTHFNPPTNAEQLDDDVEEYFSANETEQTEQPEQAERVISVRDKITLTVTADSSSPEELSLTAKITIPQTEEVAVVNSAYVPFDASDALEIVKARFSHPIIRWGSTKIRFTFPKFNVELLISPGDIKVTENGRKVLFDNLKNFEFGLNVKSRSERHLTNSEKKRAFKQIKELFRATSIRQIFKRCLDNYNEQTDYFKEYPDKIVNTTSSVSYGNSANSQFHFFGAADMENLFALHGVIARKISPKNAKAMDKDDPAYMNFGVLIKLGKVETPATAVNGFGAIFAEESEAKCKLPVLSLPCFFTNFCSAEQLTYSKLNERGLLRNGENIPVNLHIRDTFQPLTASIASGFSTFLTLFHMDHYPKFLEWNLIVPNEQIIGMEMNGQGMFVGKASPLNIVKIAEIPYTNVRVISDISNISANPRPLSFLSQNETPLSASISNQGNSKIDYGNIYSFDTYDFNSQLLVDEFKDEVIIPVKAQFPDSLPGLLRKTLWPVFVSPMDTMSLHPPLTNVEGKVYVGEMVQLGHHPMAMALSDSMDYTKIGENGHKIIEKPSLLVRLFAAFVEESSSPGIDAHKIKLKGDDPSCFRLHYACSLNNLDLKTVSKVFGSGENVHLVIWSQFPWAMGSIGFDFGKAVNGKIYLPTPLLDGDKPILIEGALTRHHMIGEVARIRVDLHIPLKYFYQILQLIHPILSHFSEQYVGSFFNYYINRLASTVIDLKELENNPLGADFVIGDNFEFKTEFIIPNEIFRRPEIPLNSSQTVVELKTLVNTRLNDRLDHLDFVTYNDTYEIIDKYRKEAPQAVACIFTTSSDMKSEAKKQGYLWDNLDLSQTRVYYADELKGIKPGDRVNVFFQLRSSDHFPVCGLRQGVNGLAVAIEYIRPKRPFELLFNNQSYFADPPTEYVEAFYDQISSIFLINHSFAYTGRYKVSVALVKDEKNLEKLKYKEIKFTEIYIKNVR